MTTKLSYHDQRCLRRLARSDSVVRVTLDSGGDVLSCVIQLVQMRKALEQRVMELENIAPRKIKRTDGTFWIWHCPDELIPETTIE